MTTVPSSTVPTVTTCPFCGQHAHPTKATEELPSPEGSPTFVTSLTCLAGHSFLLSVAAPLAVI